MFIDLFVCVLLVWAVYNGWRNGFVKEIFSTLGILTGLILAGIVYAALGDDWLAVTGSRTNMILNVGMFIILWVLLPIALGLVANILTRAVKGLQLGLFNCLLGTVFSVAKFALLISCVLNMMARLDILDESKTAESNLFEPAVSLLPFIDHETGASERVSKQADTLWVDLSGGKESDKEEAL